MLYSLIACNSNGGLNHYGIMVRARLMVRVRDKAGDTVRVTPGLKVRVR